MKLELEALREKATALVGALRAPPRNLIGLDLGSGGMGAVQLASKRPGHGSAAAWLPADPSREEDLAGRIGRLLASAPFRGRTVATAMPTELVKLMVLNYEADDENEARTVLERVRERIDEPIDRCVVDFLPIRTDDERKGERSALAVVAPRETVIEHLESLRCAGLAVEALEIAPVAVSRLVARASSSAAGTARNLLIIQGEAHRSSLTVFWGRRLILYREIPFGEEPLVEELSKTLDAEAQEAREMLYAYGVWPASDRPDAPLVDAALADEISRTVLEILKPSFLSLAEQVRNVLTYTASRMRGGTVDELRLLGCVARWPGAERLLSSLTGVEALPLDPWESLVKPTGAGAASLPHPADLAVAAGLALHGVSRDE